MTEAWKRTEVLLEEIKSDVKAIAEGHSVLDRKIEAFREEVNGQFKNIYTILKGQGNILKGHGEMLKEHGELLKEHGTILNEIKQDLREHIRQSVPPAHVSV